ncbi:MAG: hypothetical protein ABJD24_10575 [Acidimicrobiales bacterium]
MSRRCALGPVEVAQLELGRADLNSDELAEVVAAYAVPRVVFPEFRSLVKVDLAAGSVSVTVSDTAVEETAADRTLLVYFELIFGPSKMSPTTAIPFTALDLDVLRVVLASRRNEVTRHLELLVGPPLEPSVSPRRIAHGVVVVLAAASIAAGVISLIDAQNNTATKAPPVVGSAPPSPAVIAPAGAPIQTEILDPLVIVRDPSLIPGTPIDLAKGPR